MLTMRYTKEELKMVIDRANKMGAYALYFVDSFGYMQTTDVERLFGLSSDCRVVLYAPTYRDAGNIYEPIDIDAVIVALKEQFGGNWVCLMRMHYLGSTKKEKSSVISATDYPDMQELLAASDVLISDYSSSIWDFSFTGRPCLLYTPDVDLYVEKRGLDTPINTWGFPVCKTNTSLCNQILHWDGNAYKKKMAEHHNRLGSCETGKATEMISKRMRCIRAFLLVATLS